MKTIKMHRDFTYRASRVVHVQYLSGARYERVPEAAVSEIVMAKAGKIIERDVRPKFRTPSRAYLSTQE